MQPNATILDGKKFADEICSNLKDRVECLKSLGSKPKLIIITASEDPASKVYVRNKIKRCEEIGIECEHIVVEKLTKETMEKVKLENCPVIVQMPFASDELSVEDLGEYITAENDVDGFVNMKNVFDLAIGKTPLNYPCTPLGIVKLLDKYAIQLENSNVVILGRSNIVGRPLARMLEHRGANVTILHSRTSAFAKYQNIRPADIVISATGKIETITYSLIEDCCYDPSSTSTSFDKIFIDVGINRDTNGKLCGDIPKEIKENSMAYTPVPGGVGPLTVATLMSNVVESYERRT